MDARTAAFWVVFLLALGVAGYRFYRLFRPLLSAPGEARWNRPWVRLGGVALDIGLHRRLLKTRYSGTLHLMIFSGFVVLFTAIVQSFGAGLFPGFDLAPVGGNSWIALLQEIFAVVLFAGLGMATYHRQVIRPARFAGSNATDANVIYLLIALVVATMLLDHAFRIVAGADASQPWRPLSSAIAAVVSRLGLTQGEARLASEASSWAHALSILGFLVYIPGSKHRHMFTAAFNIFFRNLDPKGTLPAAGGGASSSAIDELPAFTWKAILDLYSCTECGRCQAVCPAYASGLPLSPKLLVMDLRDALLAPRGSRAGDAGALVGEVIRQETLWACTTCRACMEVCPLHIEHVPKIVDMRRTLVESGRVEPMLQEALSHLQQYGNSFGRAPRQRARWTRELGFKVKDARQAPVDVLWFVGDYAAFDPRAQRVTRQLANILHASAIDFGILYDAEHDSGNDARRAGEEGLFEMLAQHNIEQLAACRFNRIMTTDPHSLNALRNEYPRLAKTRYEVVPHTDLLRELLESGALVADPAGKGTTVTYHDPCYLGRYNGGFDSPRRIIERLGYRLHDMPRCRENSFCCGAGGGRIWMDDSAMNERPSEARIKEALALGDASLFVVACPKDLVMYTAATQSLGVEEKLQVVDIVDLVASAMAATAARQTTEAGHRSEAGEPNAGSPASFADA